MLPELIQYELWKCLTAEKDLIFWNIAISPECYRKILLCVSKVVFLISNCHKAFPYVFLLTNFRIQTML